ncbi:MAG: tol-pal system protein YbgF [Alteromonadaceae bacterium]|jgi:tol-pal system protein YbgF
MNDLRQHHLIKKLKRVIGFTFAISSGSLMAAAPITDQSSNKMDERMATLERLITVFSQSQLGIQQQLDTLNEDVSDLRGATEVHGHKLEQLVERQRELYQELENRFSRASANSAGVQPGVQTSSTTTAVSGQPTEVLDSSYTGSVSENEAYDRAVNLVIKERLYDKAIPEFKAFLKQFPQSDYAANAYYWLGQLLFNKGHYSDAQSQFEQVINYFPDSNKRSDAMLKRGSIALKNNDKETAKVFFSKVIEEYPGSTSAKLAASRLQSVK